jgi:hypothetical protein
MTPPTAWLPPFVRVRLVDVPNPSGIRRLLRHRLARPTAAIAAIILLGAALLDVGDRFLFTLLAAFPAAQVLVDLLLARLGRPRCGSSLAVSSRSSKEIRLGRSTGRRLTSLRMSERRKPRSATKPVTMSSAV